MKEKERKTELESYPLSRNRYTSTTSPRTEYLMDMKRIFLLSIVARPYLS